MSARLAVHRGPGRYISLTVLGAPIQDGLRPTGTNQSGLPDPNEEISERRRIEDTGVIDNNDTHAQ